MDDLTAEILDGIDSRPTRLVYGVATAVNTVAVRGAATAVVMPALIAVKSGDYCAVLESGGDRLILGPVGATARSGLVVYDQSTTASTSIAAVTLVTVIATSTVADVPAGDYILTAQVGDGCTTSVANSEIYFYIYVDGARVQTARFFNTTVNTKAMPALSCTAKYTHAGGTFPECYSAVQLASGTGAWYATSTSPAFLMVTRA